MDDPPIATRRHCRILTSLSHSLSARCLFPGRRRRCWPGPPAAEKFLIMARARLRGKGWGWGLWERSKRCCCWVTGEELPRPCSQSRRCGGAVRGRGARCLGSDHIDHDTGGGFTQRNSRRPGQGFVFPGLAWPARKCLNLPLERLTNSSM